VTTAEIAAPGRRAIRTAQLAALAWGLQFAFLNPALALVLTLQLHASTAQVGLVLALYNGSGFIASLVLPAWADRRREYLGLMIGCGACAFVLAVVLALTSSLVVATVALIVVGAPAGVGSSLYFAHLRAAGWGRAAVMNTRAMVSLAWVAGPPLATLLVGTVGPRSLPAAIVALSVIGTITILMMRRAQGGYAERAARTEESDGALSRWRVSAVVVAFVALQATNAAMSSVMTLFVVKSLHLHAVWGGAALAVAALAEVPALYALGRLSNRFAPATLLAVGSMTGIAFYALMAVVHDPVSLVAVQLLNAWFFATVTGIGLTWFQDIIPRPGLASGLFTNTRRIGSIVAGGVVAVAGTSFGYPGMFLGCAALSAAGLSIILAVRHRRIRTA